MDKDGLFVQTLVLVCRAVLRCVYDPNSFCCFRGSVTGHGTGYDGTSTFQVTILLLFNSTVLSEIFTRGPFIK